LCSPMSQKRDMGHQEFVLRESEPLGRICALPLMNQRTIHEWGTKGVAKVEDSRICLVLSHPSAMRLRKNGAPTLGVEEAKKLYCLWTVD